MKLVACVFATLLLASAALAAGSLSYAGKFYANGGEFDLAIYTTADNGKVGVVGIESPQPTAKGQKRLSVAFDPSEWNSFADLWQRASKVQAKDWKSIGTFKETGTDDPALLTVMAGPSVQFVITDTRGTFSFALVRSDYAAFTASIRQITTGLGP